jgi:hypothetical protein
VKASFSWGKAYSAERKPYFSKQARGEESEREIDATVPDWIMEELGFCQAVA